MLFSERRGLAESTTRLGFTLIELMVVITIIAAIIALSAGATLKFISSQQIANTRSTLDRTQSQLNNAWLKVKDQAYRETIPLAVSSWIQTNLAGNDANATGRVRVIYVKLRLRQAFPMNFTEALSPPTLPPNNQCPMPPLPAYVQYLGPNPGGLGYTGSTGANYESSACLLMALQRGVSGAGIDPSQLTTGGATSSTPTPSGGTLTFLTDAWGQPIFFSRVPVGNPALNPSGSQAGANDPGDPQGYLQTPTWGTNFGPQFTLVTLQQLAPGNTSFRIAPMLASSGPDKTVQFNPVTFQPTAGADDLFSTP